MTSSFDILARAAAGDSVAEQEAMRLFKRGLQAYFRARGSLSLERCLGLPSSQSARREFMLNSRDFWLATAHAQCEGVSPWKKSLALAAEVEAFTTRIWPVWRDHDEPPPGASQLRTSLFFALVAADQMRTARGLPSMPGTARQLHERVKRKGGETSLDRPETEAFFNHKEPTMPIPTPEQQLAMDILAAWRSDSAIRAEFGTLNAYACFREAQVNEEVKS